MKVLCIDVGMGTQDILLFDSEKRPENCIQLVIPSRAALASRTMQTAIIEDRDILFTGPAMGSFSLGTEFESYVKRRSVYATETAAVTFDDDPEAVTATGIKVVAEDEALRLRRSGMLHFEMGDVDLAGITGAIEGFGERADWNGIAVAVQDHGAAPGSMSDREFRFRNYRRLLENGAGLPDFCYRTGEIPGYLTRMKAVAESLAGVHNLLLMDTGIAAVLGSLEDERVAQSWRKLLVNVGNGHTLAVLMDGYEIIALYEHHTSILRRRNEGDPGSLHDYIGGLLDEGLTHDDVFSDGGHGLYVREGATHEAIEIRSVIGPNRFLLGGEGFYHPSPHGNMMLAGSYGLLRGYEMRYGLDRR